MNVLLLLLFIFTILYSWVRLVEPGSHFVEGDILHVVPMPLLARMRMHSAFVAAPVIAGAVLAMLDILPWRWVILPVISAVMLIAIPIRYTLTSTGIRRSFGAFRRWTEFGRVNRAPGGARLLPVSGTRGMRIWLSGSRGDDEFLLMLRSLIRDAYKGAHDVVNIRPNQSPSGSDGAAYSSTNQHIAAFTRE